MTKFLPITFILLFLGSFLSGSIPFDDKKPALALSCPSDVANFKSKYKEGPLSKKPVHGTYFGLLPGQNEKPLNGLLVVLSDGSVLIGVTDYLGTNGHTSIYQTWQRQLDAYNESPSRKNKKPLTIAAGLWSGEFVLGRENGKAKNQIMSTTSGLFHEYESHTGTPINRIQLGVAAFEQLMPELTSENLNYYIWQKDQILRGAEPVHLDRDVNDYIVEEMRAIARQENVENEIAARLREVRSVSKLKLEDLQEILVELHKVVIFDGNSNKLIDSEDIKRLFPKLTKWEGEELAKYLRTGLVEAALRAENRKKVELLEAKRAELLKSGRDLSAKSLTELRELRKSQSGPPNFRHDINNDLNSVVMALNMLRYAEGDLQYIEKVRQKTPAVLLFLEKLIASGVVVDEEIEKKIAGFVKSICRIYDLDPPMGEVLSLSQLNEFRTKVSQKMASASLSQPLPIRALPSGQTEVEWAAEVNQLILGISYWTASIFNAPDEFIETFHFIPVKEKKKK